MSAPVELLSKIQFSKISLKLWRNTSFDKKFNFPKIVKKHFFWWVEQINIQKNIFLAQFKIVQNFH